MDVISIRIYGASLERQGFRWCTSPCPSAIANTITKSNTRWCLSGVAACRSTLSALRPFGYLILALAFEMGNLEELGFSVGVALRERERERERERMDERFDGLLYWARVYDSGDL
eukprot:TRINITY_DN7661_c0_g1_i1.p1 TRINITY_DN7661_c0_g1~~TRINITY_DN7661_c0_g1_i1.p1  ORF type:complete len:115 (-),score=14.30 TRINITY_DN7661_c0_g1_i1:208-552(-)